MQIVAFYCTTIKLVEFFALLHGVIVALFLFLFIFFNSSFKSGSDRLFTENTQCLVGILLE